ncbi:hypothetical protein [Candidatus Bathycorpusculum sp.]|uniref:hypothetical protein n=1 Tax=Candidatus Bathycorpusculum sp. TaxID=2994959 RepID=UPI002838E7E1|nr:hypothetical protein [Candidatus Termitimicrobium sp.]
MLTNFTPQHSFSFDNNFTTELFRGLTAKGLCGGWSYAALDYYFTNKPIPPQTFRPATGTILHKYLTSRQTDSILNNLDTWIEIGLNPNKKQTSKFFHRGISTNPGGCINELSQFLDKGKPCVLGLQSDDTGSGNHQVIAYGYNMGRYKGDYGTHLDEFEIYVCDPEHPKTKRTLIADATRQVFCYKKRHSTTWRTYFVHKNYQPCPPPLIHNPTTYPNDGLTYELVLKFETGNDDLRGGNDNIDLLVNLTDGTQQIYHNINLSARWLSHSSEFAQIILPNPIQPKQLHNLTLSTTSKGGISGDNWDMTKLTIYEIIGTTLQEIKKVGFKRFTGNDKTLLIPINNTPTLSGQINKLELTFKTGSDDLRGCNDNLNLYVHFRDGTTQSVYNVNGGNKWNKNSSLNITINLNRAVLPSDITAVTLETTFRGGINSDNWNLDAITIKAAGPDINQEIITKTGNPYKRFTANNKTLTLRR